MTRIFATLFAISLFVFTAMAQRGTEVKPGDFNPQVLYEGAPKGGQRGSLLPVPTPAAQMGTMPTPAPIATPVPAGGGTLTAEIEGLGEELSYLAVTSFEPESQTGTGAAGQAAWQPTHAANAEVGRILTEFAASAPLAEEEKVVRITNEAIVAKGAAVGENVRLNATYKDILAALNDHSAGPMTEADLDELVGLLHGFLGPVKVQQSGMNFGPEDYCFKSVFETTERKFRLNIIRSGGKYLWFVEEVV